MKFRLVEEDEFEKSKRRFKYYNNGEVTKRFFDDEEIPDGWELGHLTLKGRKPWNQGLTSETDERVRDIATSGASTRKRLGVYDNVWNKEKKQRPPNIIKMQSILGLTLTSES